MKIKILDVWKLFKNIGTNTAKKQIAKTIAIQILTRLGFAFTGPIGWIASSLLGKYIVKAYDWTVIKVKWVFAMEKNKLADKADEKRVENVTEADKDGSTEKKQIDADLDLLNGK